MREAIVLIELTSPSDFRAGRSEGLDRRELAPELHGQQYLETNVVVAAHGDLDINQFAA
jgi:hypothetical protein